MGEMSDSAPTSTRSWYLIASSVFAMAFLSACNPTRTIDSPLAATPRPERTTFIAHNGFTSPDCAKQQGLENCAQQAANDAGIPVAWSPSPRGFQPDVMSAIWGQTRQAVEKWQRGALTLDVASGPEPPEPGRTVREFRWNGSEVVLRLRIPPRHPSRWAVSARWTYLGQAYEAGAVNLNLNPAVIHNAKWQAGLNAVMGLFQTLRYANPS